MNSDTLIVTFNTEPWNLAVTLDIVFKEIRKKKKITWFLLEAESLDSDFLPLSNKIRHHEVRELLNKLGEANINFFKNVEIINSIDLVTMQSKFNKRTKEVARAELISRLRESNPCEIHNQKALGEFSRKYFELNQYFNTYLAKNKFNKAYVFNGRPLCERAFSDAALSTRQNLVYFETFDANWIDRYFLFNKPTHSAKYRSQIMLDFSKTAQRKNRRQFKEDASVWFERRIAGITQSYTKKQRITDELNLTKPFYVYFNSSQDEIDMVGLTDEYWGDQFKTLGILVSLFRSESQYQFVLRVHPHLRHKSKKDQNNWDKIGKELQSKYPWFTYFGPDDPVSSYKLIQEAHGVITSGSTIGVEAAYLKRTSILLGNAFHKSMGITINPKNKDQLRQFIFGSKLSKNFKRYHLAALNYGYFHANGGQVFNFIEHLDKKSYHVNSLSISYSWYLKIIRKIELKFSSTLLRHKSNVCSCDNLINTRIRW